MIIQVSTRVSYLSIWVYLHVMLNDCCMTGQGCALSKSPLCEEIRNEHRQSHLTTINEKYKTKKLSFPQIINCNSKLLTTKCRHHAPKRSVVYVLQGCKQSQHRQRNMPLLCWQCNRGCSDIDVLYIRKPTPAVTGSWVQFWSPFFGMLKNFSWRIMHQQESTFPPAAFSEEFPPRDFID